MVLLPENSDLTLSELREIAARQQQQIEAQQQLLIAKVQRLKFLKQQEARHHQEAQTTENERLRFFQEKLESQELKLRRLRTLNGQVEQQRANNNKLSSELESVRLLFAEKEKELSSAIQKVGDLTLQLDELRQGNLNELKNDNVSISSSTQELVKLRHELLYHTKLTEQQNTRITQQRKLITQRQDEVMRADQRIWELKQRLHRKQLHNQQLSKQLQMTVTVPKQGVSKQLRPLSCNVAAVEPVRRPQEPERSQDDIHAKLTSIDDFKEFFPNKNDPKYQTLPYNTKFAVRNGTPPDEPDSTVPKVDNRPVAFMPPDIEKGNMLIAKAVPAGNISPSNVSSNKSYPSSRINHFTPRPYGPVYNLSQASPLPVSGSNSTAVVHPVITSSNNYQPSNTATSLPYSPIKSNNTFNSSVNQTERTEKSNYITTNSTISTNSIPWVKSLPGKSENAKLLPESSSSTQNKPIVPPKPVKPLPPPRQIHTEGNSGDKQENVDLALAVLKSSGLENTSGFSGYKERLLYYQYFPRYSLRSGITKNSHLDKKEQPKHDDGSFNDSENSTSNLREDSSQKRTVIGQLPIQPKPLTIKKPIGVEPPRLRSSIPILSSHKRTGESNLQSHSLLQFNKHTHHKNDHSLNLQSTESEHTSSDTSERENNSNSSGTSITDRLSEVIETVSSLENNEKEEEKQKDEENKTDLTETQLEKDEPFSHFNDIINLDNENNIRTEGDGDSGCETVPPSNLSYTCEPKAITEPSSQEISTNEHEPVALRRVKKGNLKTKDSAKSPRRVSFDPLALLLDAALEGEVELVKKTACEVPNPSAANDEGITALHNAICAGHLEIVTFLVELGCDVNTQDSDGWTPLHCAASCNNLPMVKYLVEHGACIFATTLSDHETAAEKCEEDEDGFDGCSEYLYSIQEKLGIMNGGVVYAVYDYELQNPDELSFQDGDKIVVLKKGDELEREWWWSQLNNQEGYVPRNLLGLYPRVTARKNQ
ncbi:apoptosis-stimulating of p53 protein 1-like isoform X1 [Centruroides sculpturatus]|uniref:apoptosis-stimulating of p53 protein 1-like isoform X1 n=1 Tax=Centruroides sculpturatus TaxID=218467 RepID=UPI000C6C9049|nr:apoptosis-stimulating of p53 protein 1-like isoform X1 [Centruroides sculpturatus]